MKFPLQLALRFFSSRKRGTARFNGFAAIFGIAIGVAGLIAAVSLATGFANEINSKLLKNTPNFLINNESNLSSSNSAYVARKIERIEGVEKVVIENSVYAAIAINGNSEFVLIVADDDEESDSQMGEFAVPESVLTSIGAQIGDLVEVTYLGDEGLPISNEVKITGVNDKNGIGLLPKARASKHNFSKVISNQKVYMETMGIVVNDSADSDEVKERIANVLGNGYSITSSEELNKPLFSALKLERTLTFSIISLIILIAVLNITAFVSLVVNERRRDIAVLRICGMQGYEITRTFFVEGFLFGAIGVGIGLILGLIACALGNYFELVSLPEEVYIVSYVPFNVRFVNVLLIVLVSLLFSAISAWLPARKAQNIKPFELLRG